MIITRPLNTFKSIADEKTFQTALDDLQTRIENRRVLVWIGYGGLIRSYASLDEAAGIVLSIELVTLVSAPGKISHYTATVELIGTPNGVIAGTLFDSKADLRFALSGYTDNTALAGRVTALHYTHLSIELNDSHA